MRVKRHRAACYASRVRDDRGEELPLWVRSFVSHAWLAGYRAAQRDAVRAMGRDREAFPGIPSSGVPAYRAGDECPACGGPPHYVINRGHRYRMCNRHDCNKIFY
jgi:hypothetical protein